MSTTEQRQDVSFTLPEQTVAQLEELVRNGRFKDYQTAVAAAVERLHAEECPPLDARRAALARACGALRLGTAGESLRNAERDRLEWESRQR